MAFCGWHLRKVEMLSAMLLNHSLVWKGSYDREINRVVFLQNSGSDNTGPSGTLCVSILRAFRLIWLRALDSLSFPSALLFRSCHLDQVH